MHDNPALDTLIPSVSNAPLGNCSYCLGPNNFNQDIYPRLVELQQQGVQVLCIGGDIGNTVKKFEHITPEGIILLASGIKSYDDDNRALLIHHDFEEQTLSWEFRLLSDLPMQ